LVETRVRYGTNVVEPGASAIVFTPCEGAMLA
jgi:hypothetical protein